jgi:hypothetical protein
VVGTAHLRCNPPKTLSRFCSCRCRRSTVIGRGRWCGKCCCFTSRSLGRGWKHSPVVPNSGKATWQPRWMSTSACKARRNRLHVGLFACQGRARRLRGSTPTPSRRFSLHIAGVAIWTTASDVVESRRRGAGGCRGRRMPLHRPRWQRRVCQSDLLRRPTTRRKPMGLGRNRCSPAFRYGCYERRRRRALGIHRFEPSLACHKQIAAWSGGQRK